MVSLTKELVVYPVSKTTRIELILLRDSLSMSRIEELNKWSDIPDKYSFIAIYHQATIKELEENIKSLDTIINLLPEGYDNEDND